MAKVTVEAFAKLWGQVIQLDRRKLETLYNLIGERRGAKPVSPEKATRLPRKAAETPPEGA